MFISVETQLKASSQSHPTFGEFMSVFHCASNILLMLRALGSMVDCALLQYIARESNRLFGFPHYPFVLILGLLGLSLDPSKHSSVASSCTLVPYWASVCPTIRPKWTCGAPGTHTIALPTSPQTLDGLLDQRRLDEFSPVCGNFACSIQKERLKTEFMQHVIGTDVSGFGLDQPLGSTVLYLRSILL